MRIDRFRGALTSSLERYGGLLSVIALMVITIGSLLPRESGGDLGGSDKLVHFVAYAVAILPVTQLKARTQLIFAMGVLIWSGVIELVQPSVGRSASLMDFVANAAGLSIGLVAGVIIDRFFFRKNSNAA